MLSALSSRANLLRISSLNFGYAQTGKRMERIVPMSFDPVFYTRTGQPSTEKEALADLSKFVEGLRHSGKKGVLLVGELHDDAEGHKVELRLLERVFEMARSQNLKFGFALEMYDRATQPVLDEFVAGLLDYETFLKEVGPSAPGNHESYRPLLEFCRDRRIPAVGSNCPRRYTKLVSNHGRQILATLPESSRGLVAPLTYRDSSAAYRDHFLPAMFFVHSAKWSFKGGPEAPLKEKMAKMLDSQTLWDATMAFSIFESLKKCDVVMHVSGYFHMKYDLGIVEHVRHLDGDVQSRSVIIKPDVVPDLLETSDHNSADWIVVTAWDEEVC